MRNLMLLSLCLALLFLCDSYANGRLIIFGDSLSDVGNAWIATNGEVPPLRLGYGHTYDTSGNILKPTFPGRFTDGQNWVDYLPVVAKSFGVYVPTLAPSLSDPENHNATNFAVGGATSGNINVLGITLPNKLPARAGRVARSTIEEIFPVGSTAFRPLPGASHVFRVHRPI